MSIFYEYLRDLLERDVSVIATVDHPYPSPPVHLYDGHLRLHRTFGTEALLVNWDVSTAGDRFYRHDLITDTGLVAKHPRLYHYRLDVPYALQRFDSAPWKLLTQAVQVAAEGLQQQHRLPDAVVGPILTRAQTLVSTLSSTLDPDSPPWQYTRSHLLQDYRSLECAELTTLLTERYLPYWGSVCHELGPVLPAQRNWQFGV